MSPLPVGVLIQDRYQILDIIHHSKQLNRYLAQRNQPVLICPAPQCGQENPIGTPFCAKCGGPLTASATYTPRYVIKEAARMDLLQTEWQVAQMSLAHPNLVPPRHVFEQTVGSEKRYCVVLDDPIWKNGAQISGPKEWPAVLSWGIGLADGLAVLHSRRIALRELDSRHIAIWDKTAQWADFSAMQVLSETEWQQTGTQRVQADVRQVALLLYRWATGLAEYNPNVNLSLPQANPAFIYLLTGGYVTAADLAKTLRDLEQHMRRPGGLDVHTARLSDVGRQRDLDEDSILTLELGQVYRSASAPLGVYVIADGMGGHEGGDVASRLTVQTIARRALNDVLGPALASNGGVNDFRAWLQEIIQEANQVVLQRRKASRNDMGTTLVMAVLVGAPEGGLQAHIAHVGDSRAYLIGQSTIRRLTTDHSLVERLVATGQIKPEEAATHPQRNVIYRNIGDRPQVEADVTTQALTAGDVLLLCCDGLNGEISDQEMLRIVTGAASLPDACRQLVDAANNAGGNDNISVILIGVRSIEP